MFSWIKRTRNPTLDKNVDTVLLSGFQVYLCSSHFPLLSGWCNGEVNSGQPQASKWRYNFWNHEIYQCCAFFFQVLLKLYICFCLWNRLQYRQRLKRDDSQSQIMLWIYYHIIVSSFCRYLACAGACVLCFHLDWFHCALLHAGAGSEQFFHHVRRAEAPHYVMLFIHSFSSLSLAWFVFLVHRSSSSRISSNLQCSNSAIHNGVKVEMMLISTAVSRTLSL